MRERSPVQNAAGSTAALGIELRFLSFSPKPTTEHSQQNPYTRAHVHLQISLPGNQEPLLSSYYVPYSVPTTPFYLILNKNLMKKAGEV